eukprot:2488936-Alexandrium_andersonii.AAC.1
MTLVRVSQVCAVQALAVSERGGSHAAADGKDDKVGARGPVPRRRRPPLSECWDGSLAPYLAAGAVALPPTLRSTQT